MSNSPHRQQGYTLLTTTMILLVLISMGSMLTGQTSIMEQRVINNEYRMTEAFEAAEAGVEYAMVHLNENQSTILVDSDSNGFIDAYTHANIANVTQSNNTTYTASYANPTANNFEIIDIVATGVSADGRVSRTVRQTFSVSAVLKNPPPSPLVTRETTSISGDVTVTNTALPYTIISGGAVALTGSASTDAGDGEGSDSSGLNADISQNNTTLSSMTGDEFFQSFFGVSKAEAKSISTVHTGSSNTDYSSTLDGETGKVIWLDHSAGGEARINSNVVIGSPTAPVILFVEGDFKLAGGATIHGLVYVTNDWNNIGSGTAEVNGSVIVEGDYSATGTPNINYNNITLDSLPKSAAVKVPGTWRDF